MSPTYEGTKLPTCYATCSIGHKPEHDLPSKLEAISAAGFEAIELSMPDILSYAEKLNGKQPDPKDFDTLVEVGKEIKKLTQKYNLKILMLQPFSNFEGWIKGKQDEQRNDAWERARGWSRIMEAVGTDMLQVGSSDAPGISTSFEDSASDLAELADMLAEKNFRIAYENWCWSTHATSWKDVWTIIKLANRQNLGLCLDTFQSAGGEWGDPRTQNGLLQDVSSKDEIEKHWQASLKEMSETIPAEKIFLLQISDAYKMDPAIPDKVDDSGLRPRGQWSHDYRPLPYDGGYLPIVDFLKATLATGFKGWLSIEVFDGQGPEKYDGMQPFAEKAMKSVDRMVKECSK